MISRKRAIGGFGSCTPSVGVLLWGAVLVKALSPLCFVPHRYKRHNAQTITIPSI
jgi:hypothetical protein